MSLEDQIRRIAINEVLEPTFELTRQYLQVNTVATADGIPLIEDIVIDEEEKTAAVYFPIVDEKYYFVIYLDIALAITIRFMSMSAGNDVELLVCSDRLSLSEIQAILKIKPSKTWEKGQPIFGNRGALHKESGFLVSPFLTRTGEVEDKLKALAKLLIPWKDQLFLLSEVATTEIQIGYYGYKDQMWGVHLDYEVLKAISDLHLSIDIDIEASGSDLLD